MSEATLPRLGMGCMRLSTPAERDEGRAIAVIHAALDAGVRLLDTADAYAHDASEMGHNERLIARALRSWPGDRRDVVVATKGGLTRPGGQWIPDGRARRLTEACAASRAALGVERIQLYQLHVPDPRTSLATSVRALEALRRDGHIDAIGLCNVTVGQIEEAVGIAPIASVQVELGVWCDDAVLGGVVAYCVAHGLPILASRPLGGERRRARTDRDPVLRDIAARHGATPAEIALAALFALSELVTPLPGPTRPETAASIARAASIVLEADDLARLAERFPVWRPRRATPASAAPSQTEASCRAGPRATSCSSWAWPGQGRARSPAASSPRATTGSIATRPAARCSAPASARARPRRGDAAASSSTTPICRASRGRRSSTPRAGSG